MARAFVLMTPVHPVLHRVSCSYETITNAPKHYTMHQNMSLWSNGVDWMRSLWKIPTWLRGTSIPRFASSFMQLPNDNKCTQTLCNTPKHEFYSPMGSIRCVRCEKLQRDFVARTFKLIEPVRYVLQQVSCSYERIPNAPKYYETDQNISFGSNWVDWVCSLQKKPDMTLWHELLH